MDQNEVKAIIEELKSKKTKIFKPDGSEFKVPKEGSLGLLALGYKGILAWKNKILN